MIAGSDIMLFQLWHSAEEVVATGDVEFPEVVETRRKRCGHVKLNLVDRTARLFPFAKEYEDPFGPVVLDWVVGRQTYFVGSLRPKSGSPPAADGPTATVWRWDADSESICFVGNYRPAAGDLGPGETVRVATVIDNSPLRHQWPRPFPSPWSDRVVVASAQTGASHVDPVGDDASILKVLTGRGREHIIAAKADGRFTNYSSFEIVQPRPKQLWSVGRRDFEARVGETILGQTLVRGPASNAPWLVLGLTTVSGRLLFCGIDCRTGSIESPIETRMGTPDSSAWLANASSDGSLVAWTTHEHNRTTIGVWDVAQKRRLIERVVSCNETIFGERQQADLYPAGFCQDKRLLLSDHFSIVALAPPYTGELQPLFTLSGRTTFVSHDAVIE
jgi:hypothetical protein